MHLSAAHFSIGSYSFTEQIRSLFKGEVFAGRVSVGVFRFEPQCSTYLYTDKLPLVLMVKVPIICTEKYDVPNLDKQPYYNPTTIEP